MNITVFNEMTGLSTWTNQVVMSHNAGKITFSLTWHKQPQSVNKNCTVLKQDK